MNTIARILKAEPVLLGAAVVATFEAAAPDASSAWKLAAGAIVAWFVRMLSTPEAKAQERIDEATVIGEQVGRVKAEDELRAYARAQRSKRK